MSGPYVTIIVPPLGPGLAPQTITVDIQGPKQVYIIGDGQFGIGFADAEGLESVAGQFGGGEGKGNEALKNVLEEATRKIKEVNSGSTGPTTGGAPATQTVGTPSKEFPGATEEDVKMYREMSMTDDQIRAHLATQPAKQPETPAAPATPEQQMPGVPIPDLKDMENTEQRVEFLESLEDKEDLGNKKLAFGLFRNAKDESRQDLVERICNWLDLPEMIVESQAPKSA